MRVTENGNRLPERMWLNISSSGDTENLSGSDAVWSALGEPALPRGLDYMVSRGPF